MDNVLVIGGGAIGGSLKSIIVMIMLPTLTTLISVFICAIIGGVTGWLVKFLLDTIKKKIQKG